MDQYATRHCTVRPTDSVFKYVIIITHAISRHNALVQLLFIVSKFKPNSSCSAIGRNRVYGTSFPLFIKQENSEAEKRDASFLRICIILSVAVLHVYARPTLNISFTTAVMRVAPKSLTYSSKLNFLILICHFFAFLS
jgi:hypothetical protein